ncbi:MAG: hypothetical protein JJE29_00015 [Peptostreptococcaceae bacterium]|nr:hypothetical protein [Peptostreptococcaceae bacterium]
MSIYAYIAIIAVLFILFFARQQKKLRNSESFSKSALDFFNSLDNFTPSYGIFGIKDPSGHTKAMAIDPKNESICLYDENEKNKHHIMNYSELVSSEIFENETSISFFSDDSKILKLNFEKELAEEEKKILRLSVECTFISEKVPSFKIYTINSSGPVDNNEYLFKREETNKWHRLMVKIIDYNNESVKHIY